MRILVLGASGMLGNAVFRLLSEKADWKVFGTLRSEGAKRFFPPTVAHRLLVGVDVEHQHSLLGAFEAAHPQVVINCVGLVKQLSESDDPLRALPINSLLPHYLARLCGATDSRLIHISTDCVFSGNKGQYSELDFPDATDLYGRSKYLGEVDYPHATTLRTSLIGHELQGARSLVDWFLSQTGACRGYQKAVFSGLPTVVIAQIIRDIVIPRRELKGVYHLAAAPITKYELLKLVADVYGKKINIIPDVEVVIDRSLNASKFREATGFVAPPWKELVELMFAYR